MTEFKNDDALEKRIVAALERRAESPDPALERRLDRARRLAIAEADVPRRPWLVWPALGTAGAAAVVAMLVLIQPSPDTDPGLPTLPQSDDLDLLTQEEYELFAEDPEFYAWIAERPIRQRARARGKLQEEST
jgi:hypothetical protein